MSNIDCMLSIWDSRVIFQNRGCRNADTTLMQKSQEFLQFQRQLPILKKLL